MRKSLISLASLLVFVAAGAQPTWAKWGCGTSGDSNSWGYGAQAGAREGALKSCLGQCSIISCSPHVDTEAQADALWPPAGGQYVYSGRKCGRAGQPKC
jgi:hypothetical protein